ncbi:MAG: cytochrome c3 family protein [Desulfobulbaceae bacterium]|nr:cytochrome c3 family protein [Desulfobulbaceae bacterium]
MKGIKRCWAVLSLVCGVVSSGISVVTPGGALAADDQECYACHKKMVDEQLRQPYVHKPFLEKRCTFCHGGERKTRPATAAGQGSDSAKGGEKSSPVKWLGESATPATSHWFLIPAASLDRQLVVESRLGSGPPQRQSFTIPALAFLPPVRDNGQPPVISDVRVVEVERGLFLSATIGWRTDEIADSAVLYGTKELSMAARDGGFGQEHRMTLVGLKANETYRFAVVSNDLFGNRRVGQTMSFSTAPKGGGAERFVPLPLQDPGGECKVEGEFFKSDGNYVVKLAVSRPATLYVGSAPVRPKSAAGGGGKDTAAAGGSHPVLSSEFVTQSSVCVSCHGRYLGTLSHPVNALPKKGMVIPPEYPTLPDGRITCMSCHRFHASDREFRLIKSSKRELCIGCHKDMA